MNICEEQITVDQHLGVVPHGLQIKIYVNDKTPIQTGIAVRDQILNNQAIGERLRQVIDDYKKQVWESPTNHRMVVKHLEEILDNTLHSGSKIQ